MTIHKGDITQLLSAWQSGDEKALTQLAPLVYAELRRLAGNYMRGERIDHTLQPTALVNEAFENLLDTDVAWNSRSHFVAVAATQMRRILVDHARARLSQKRGAGAKQVSLTLIELSEEGIDIDLLALDSALQRLEAHNPQMSRIIELHYFAGLSQRDIAEVLNQSRSAIQRHLSFARAWLLEELAQ